MMVKKCIHALPLAIVLLLCGCKMRVPIHVWQPPALGSTVGKSVAVAEIAGPTEFATTIQKNIISQAPSDPGRATTLVPSSDLQSKTQIQLVNFEDEQPSDVALAAVARREGFDFMLQGHIVESSGPAESIDKESRLALSWRLISLHNNSRSPGGMPVVVDYESAIKRYPDLGMLAERKEVLTEAAVRETYGLITPTVMREDVALAIPYLLPGSKKVRDGNIAALSGQWDKARTIWADVVDRHPAQVAALHNLAVAEAAAQNFSRAKELARKAIRLQPTQRHKQTMVWIELKQRAYHESFQLADPTEGWFVTQ